MLKKQNTASVLFKVNPLIVVIISALMPSGGYSQEIAAFLAEYIFTAQMIINLNYASKMYLFKLAKKNRILILYHYWF